MFEYILLFQNLHLLYDHEPRGAAGAHDGHLRVGAAPYASYAEVPRWRPHAGGAFPGPSLPGGARNTATVPP